ncbi:hypothetical protein [Microbispora sp. H11081]|uniref:hypothetical protein n=1 Tax=Microbispora sp. H11081 TaxID=2729107 RepID=UPI001474B876|nr:hypothetical protein [Microbispora sp. H11081]
MAGKQETRTAEDAPPIGPHSRAVVAGGVPRTSGPGAPGPRAGELFAAYAGR